MTHKINQVPFDFLGLPDRSDGTYVVLLPLKTYGGAWGRDRSLARAWQQAKKAGGRIRRKPGTKVQAVVYWQPDSALADYRAKWGPKADPEAGPPYVDQGGCLCWFGERPTCLYSYDCEGRS